VDADCQAVAFGRLVDRPVTSLAERRFGPDGEQDLDEARMVGEPVDLLRRKLCVLRWYDE
jgi:hypothetical protein